MNILYIVSLFLLNSIWLIAEEPPLSVNEKITHTYDPWGKKISRTIDGKTEYYIYFGEEMGILDSDELIQGLKVGQWPQIENTLIHNTDGKILQPIQVSNRQIFFIDAVAPFGGGLPGDTPTSWIFCGDHYDKDANLVYFERRYYSSELNQWLIPN